MPPPSLAPLLAVCGDFRRRLARLLLVGGVARVVCLAIGLFAGLSAVDWWMHWGSAMRTATLVGFLACLAYVVVGVARTIRGGWSDRDVLRYLGVVDPRRAGDWVAWYELETEPAQVQEMLSPQGRAMAAEATARMAAEFQEPVWPAVFDGRSTRRWLAAGGAAAAVLAICATLAIPEHVRIGAQRLFLPLANVRWPHRTTIVVDRPEHGWTTPQLESFPLSASVTGETPARVTLAYRTAENPTWTREKLPVRDDGTVRYTFAEVREPIDLYLEGGDYRTDPLRIAVVQRPFLKSITAHYSYPAYARLPDRSVPGGQLGGLEGAKVRLEMESSMPLDRAVLVLTPEAASGEPASRVDLVRASATRYTHELMLTTSGRYAVELYESSGYREARPEVYDIRVTPDEPPEVELVAPSRDLVETNQASIEVAFKARDQLGLNGVEFLYQLGEEPPKPLSDLLTGPIVQSGPESSARFVWELRKLELPPSGTLTCFVRVRDNNPTGRGRRDSSRRQIRLVRPSEFHLEAVEQAKLLEEEACIAWKNQLQAWELARRWKAEGTGAEADPLWNEMHDAQQRAIQAARQARVHLQTLTEKFERNHMGQDFMAARLSVVAQLLVGLQEQQHAPIAASLADARPKSAADAVAERLKSLRAAAVEQSHDRQKMSVLVLERLLRKLYDWRDLQTAAITTKLLQEQQEEVHDRTAEVAPKTIAKEIEDLSDPDQDRLLTLGKQQRAIFDTETGLEQQLTYMMYKAERQARRGILEPLRAAFGNLRNLRVNDNLKQSADLIANNQPSQILSSQKSALRALNVVLAGLLAAGQKVDEDPALTLAMTPTDAAQFDPDQIKPPEVAAKDPEKPADPATTETPQVVELPTLPEGADALSTAVRLAIEMQDNVMARTRYLENNRGPNEMPRFVALKLARLAERQTDAIAALARAQAAAQPKTASASSETPAAAPSATSAVAAAADDLRAPVDLLTLTADEFRQSQTLLAAAEVEATSQRLQADALETLRGVLHDVALRKAIDDATAENRRLNGVDAFNRPYVLRGADLQTAIALLARLHHARQRQAHVQRLVERFVQTPAVGKQATELEKANRIRAVASQRRTGELLAEVAKATERLAADVPQRVRDAALGAWAALRPAEMADRIEAADAKTLESLGPQLREAVQQLDASLLAVRDLLEERVRPEPTAVAKADEAPKMTLEEYEQMTSPERLAELLSRENSLPPEIRERMARVLQQDLPPKYRRLLIAYYASFLQPQKEPSK